jgi:hypothetical protein
MQTTKTCSNCCEILSLTAFFKDKTNKDGLTSQCKSCKNESTRLRRYNISIQDIQKPSHKTCPRCKLELSASNFTSLKTSKDGLAAYCKNCRRLNDIDRKINAKNNVVIVNESLLKVCSKCFIEKPHTQYRINRKSTDNITHICLECLPTNNWTKKKQQLSEKKYRENNPEKMREKYKKQGNNVNRRIRNSIHQYIRAIFQKNTREKTYNTFTYIGCDIQFFKNWLEFQFSDGMTWDNYGEWHMDHVIPCSTFDLSNDNEIKECFNWKNYQPLWKKDNLVKSNKIDEKYIKIHKEKAYNYENKFSKYFLAQVKEGELLETP